MSHQPLRKENNCLNCGATVEGRHCSTCGQENIVTHQTFWGLTKHFIYDILHFDGKFFETLKFLVIRPGYVPKAYTAGQRMRFLDPIRMYLFTSAIFFLLFFSLSDVARKPGKGGERNMTRQERYQYATQIRAVALPADDSSSLKIQMAWLLDTTLAITLDIDTASPKSDSSFLISFNQQPYLMKARKRQPGIVNAGDNWLGRLLEKRMKDFETRYGDDEDTMMRDLLDSIIHKLPTVFFISLPFFALILKLIYSRRRNRFYSDHAVFTLYHYIFTFILMMFLFLFDKVWDYTGWKVIEVLTFLLFFYGGVYLLLSMKTFYAQSWGRTIFKFILLNLLGLLMLFILMVIFVFLSFIQL